MKSKYLLSYKERKEKETEEDKKSSSQSSRKSSDKATIDRKFNGFTLKYELSKIANGGSVSSHVMGMVLNTNEKLLKRTMKTFKIQDIDKIMSKMYDSYLESDILSTIEGHSISDSSSSRSMSALKRISRVLGMNEKQIFAYKKQRRFELKQKNGIKNTPDY